MRPTPWLYFVRRGWVTSCFGCIQQFALFLVMDRIPPCWIINFFRIRRWWSRSFDFWWNQQAKLGWRYPCDRRVHSQTSTKPSQYCDWIAWYFRVDWASIHNSGRDWSWNLRSGFEGKESYPRYGGYCGNQSFPFGLDLWWRNTSRIRNFTAVKFPVEKSSCITSFYPLLKWSVWSSAIFWFDAVQGWSQTHCLRLCRTWLFWGNEGLIWDFNLISILQKYVQTFLLDDIREYMRSLFLTIEGMHRFVLNIQPFCHFYETYFHFRIGVIHRDVKPSNFLYCKQVCTVFSFKSNCILGSLALPRLSCRFRNVFPKNHWSG